MQKELQRLQEASLKLPKTQRRESKAQIKELATALARKRESYKANRSSAMASPTDSSLQRNIASPQQSAASPTLHSHEPKPSRGPSSTNCTSEEPLASLHDRMITALQLQLEMNERQMLEMKKNYNLEIEAQGEEIKDLKNKLESVEKASSQSVDHSLHEYVQQLLEERRVLEDFVAVDTALQSKERDDLKHRLETTRKRAREARAYLVRRQADLKIRLYKMRGWHQWRSCLSESQFQSAVLNFNDERVVQDTYQDTLRSSFEAASTDSSSAAALDDRGSFRSEHARTHSVTQRVSFSDVQEPENRVFLEKYA